MFAKALRFQVDEGMEVAVMSAAECWACETAGAAL